MIRFLPTLLLLAAACSYDCNSVSCANGCCDQGICFEGSSVKFGSQCGSAGGGSGGSSGGFGGGGGGHAGGGSSSSCGSIDDPCNASLVCCHQDPSIFTYDYICRSERCAFCINPGHECDPQSTSSTTCCPGTYCDLKPGFSTVYECQ